MKKGASVTVWFGKEIPIEDVRKTVRQLHFLGYTVKAPFYIGYNLDTTFVENYLKNSVDTSDYLYIMGNTGSLLMDIVEYAEEKGKPIVREESKKVCYQ